jgi:hypothetical protein
MFVVALTALLVSAVSAHNWINTPSRTSFGSSSASTLKPALPATTDEPQVIVRAGQKFPVEWVCGHGFDVYFVAFRKADLQRALVHEPAMMDAFLTDTTICPQTPLAKEHLNYHYKYNDTSLDFDGVAGTTGVVPPPIPNFFKRRVPSTDPNFIPRNPIFRKAFKNLPANPTAAQLALISQFEYNDTNTATNRRCHPSSPSTRYPWVVAMWRFRIVMHQPARPDVAMLDMPPSTPPGDYMIQYRWRGYTDAFDVKVVGGTVDIADPYGTAPDVGETPVVRFKRIDHCSFYQPLAVASCLPMTATNGFLDTPDACFTACKASTGCGGVAVVPLTYPNSVHPSFRSELLVNFTTTCVKPTNATHMCHTLRMQIPRETVPSLSITDDTENPQYYGTCYVRINSYDRNGLPPPASRPPVAADRPDWKAHQECVSCSDRIQAQMLNVTPAWTIAASCANCDVALASQ